MSIAVTVETDLGKVGHAFVIGASKLKDVLVWAAREEQKIKPEVTIAEDMLNEVVNAIYPGSDIVAVAIEAVFGKALDAVDALGTAAASDGVNIPLDLSAVAAIKAALPILKAQAKTTPGS